MGVLLSFQVQLSASPLLLNESLRVGGGGYSWTKAGKGNCFVRRHMPQSHSDCPVSGATSVSYQSGKVTPPHSSMCVHAPPLP